MSAGRIARWNGAVWSTLGTGISRTDTSSAFVSALAVLPGGDLAAGGYFTTAGGAVSAYIARWTTACPPCQAVNHDGDTGTDADIETFFACLAGNCCGTCGSADFNGDGDVATDADIESFFRVLAGGAC